MAENFVNNSALVEAFKHIDNTYMRKGLTGLLRSRILSPGEYTIDNNSARINFPIATGELVTLWGQVYIDNIGKGGGDFKHTASFDNVRMARLGDEVTLLETAESVVPLWWLRGERRGAEYDEVRVAEYFEKIVPMGWASGLPSNLVTVHFDSAGIALSFERLGLLVENWLGQSVNFDVNIEVGGVMITTLTTGTEGNQSLAEATAELDARLRGERG